MVKRVQMEMATNIRRGRDRARRQEPVRDRVKGNKGILFQDQDLPRLNLHIFLHNVFLTFDYKFDEKFHQQSFLYLSLPSRAVHLRLKFPV